MPFKHQEMLAAIKIAAAAGHGRHLTLPDLRNGENPPWLQ